MSKQPKISKELFRVIYPNSDVYWNTVSLEYMVTDLEFPYCHKSINDIVHDIKVYISKNFEKYGMDIVQDYHHVEVMKASAMIKEFWDDQDETYYNPQRVFEAFEWIIENCERVNEEYSNY